jgi:hypothetical protein
MSISNITSKRWTRSGYVLTFLCKDGSLRTYTYAKAAGASIQAGADPRYFTPIAGPVIGSPVSMEEIAEDAAEIAEML